MVQKHCAKTVVRATRQIVGGNYKASSCGRCKGELGKWCESKKERKKERKREKKEREKREKKEVKKEKKERKRGKKETHGFMDAIKNIRGNIEGTLRKIIIDM